MKYLIVFFFLPFSLFSQATLEPIKKSNRVIIESTDDPEIAFNKLAKSFILKGYTLKQLDSDLLIISTDERSFGNFAPYIVKISAMVESAEDGAKIILLGEFAQGSQIHWDDGTSLDLSNQFQPIKYFGTKKSPMMKSWHNLLEVAQAYQTGKIKYSKQ